MQGNNKYKNGASLIEVIVVLAIVSFTIIASMALVARSRVEIRNNEIQDISNGLLLRIVEALKAPVKVEVVSQVNSPLTSIVGLTTYSFSVNPTTRTVGNQTVTEYKLNYLRPGTFTNLPRQSGTTTFNSICTSNNPFYLSQPGLEYCLQVEINRVSTPNPAEELYRVSATIFYPTNEGAKTESLITYRYEGFNFTAR